MVEKANINHTQEIRPLLSRSLLLIVRISQGAASRFGFFYELLLAPYLNRNRYFDDFFLYNPLFAAIASPIQVRSQTRFKCFPRNFVNVQVDSMSERVNVVKSRLVGAP